MYGWSNWTLTYHAILSEKEREQSTTEAPKNAQIEAATAMLVPTEHAVGVNHKHTTTKKKKKKKV